MERQKTVDLQMLQQGPRGFPPDNAGDVRDTGWIPGSGRSPGVKSGNLLQYSCPENRGACPPGQGYSPRESQSIRDA